MNNNRRKELEKVINTLELLKQDIENLTSEEQDYLDNMSDSFQNGEKGGKSQTSIDAMKYATSFTKYAIQQINDATAK